MKVKDLIRKLETCDPELDILFKMFGVVEAANSREAYTSAEIHSGTFYTFETYEEPLFIIDRDFDELTLVLNKMSLEPKPIDYKEEQ